jgi:citrate lyase subunit beta/citryl-CoA lyase
MPIIESALGIINSYEIASASPNVVALAIGLEDYTADIGAERTNEGIESFFARSAVVNSARAAGIQPIDSVFSDFENMEALRNVAMRSKSMGFAGMGCIHPAQIRIINECFQPSSSEIEKAKRIVMAFDEAQRRGTSVISLGSKMIDAPIVKRALNTIEMAVRCQLVKPNWKEDASR